MERTTQEILEDIDRINQRMVLLMEQSMIEGKWINWLDEQKYKKLSEQLSKLLREYEKSRGE